MGFFAVRARRREPRDRRPTIDFLSHFLLQAGLIPFTEDPYK